MNDEQRQRIARAAYSIEAAATRISAEVTRTASAPDIDIILASLLQIDTARRNGFRRFIADGEK